MLHERGARKPGRPRSEKARQAILQSTLNLLRDAGFADFSVETVAAHANVGKATVYRWWPNKAALIVDAFSASADEELRYPDTGSVVQDLKIQMVHLVEIFLSPRGKIVANLIGAGQADPELTRAFRERFLFPRRKEAYATLRRGIDRGEFAPDADLDIVLDSLYGPIYMRFLIGHRDLSIDFAERLCDSVMARYILPKPR